MIAAACSSVTYGLIGFPLGHSFSADYFSEIFRREGLTNHSFKTFELPTLHSFPDLLNAHLTLRGLTVTMPYKKEIIAHLTDIDPVAAAIESVNVLHIIPGTSRQLIGYNTDAYGFETSIKPLLQPHHHRALILGTGGAASAVRFVLNKLGIDHTSVSRTPKSNEYAYSDLTAALVRRFPVIVNATPLGMEPLETKCPPIPFSGISDQHLIFDLIYNPAKTPLLLAAEKQGAVVKNGLEMLFRQADRAWEIWKGI